MLDADIKSKLTEYLALMEGQVLIRASAGPDDVSRDMLAFLEEIASMSSYITLERETLPRTPSFHLSRAGQTAVGVTFAGIPMGHEFTSFVLSLLQISGRAPKVDSSLIEQIRKLTGEYHFETFVSLSCHNCPEVVQALNIMSILNPGITHTMIDGAVFQTEAEARDVMAVPTVFLNGSMFAGGRMTLEEILSKLGTATDFAGLEKREPYDVLVIGGGPSGSSAAIYAARKGIRTGMVVDQFGGQVRDTVGIENLISVKHTEGLELAKNLEDNVNAYDVDVIKAQRAKGLQKKEYIEIELESGAILKSKTVILSTGARWRNVGVPGEAEYKNKGVAYCPHCDGPMYKGKEVAVIGGGNSGVEAAIDLAGIAKHVTVLEFLPELKADAVLQKRLYGLPNVTVRKNVATKEITGKDKVDGITYTDRATGEIGHIELQGVFVQIGLIANTDWLEGAVERNRLGEIIVNQHNATNIPGVFAAGDCTDSPYKQIIISMGSGANAALSAFDYLIRN